MYNKIVIGWSDYGIIKSNFGYSVSKSIVEDVKKRNLIGDVITITCPLVASGRNLLVSAFLETEYEWLLMIDADTIWHEEMIYDLYDIAIKNNIKVISGTYFIGFDFYDPEWLTAAYFENNINVDVENYQDVDFCEIDWAGAGALLVHRSVFEKTEINSEKEYTPYKRYWFKETEFGGEDNFFFKHIKSYGIKSYLATKIIVPHIKSNAITAKNYMKTKNIDIV
jgi:hypothetical protein